MYRAGPGRPGSFAGSPPLLQGVYVLSRRLIRKISRVHDRTALVAGDVGQAEGMSDFVGDHDGGGMPGKIRVDEDLAGRGIVEAVKVAGSRLEMDRDGRFGG